MSDEPKITLPNNDGKLLNNPLTPAQLNKTPRTVINVVVRGTRSGEGTMIMDLDKGFVTRQDADEYLRTKPDDFDHPKYVNYAIRELVVYDGPFTAADAQDELRQRTIDKLRTMLTPNEFAILNLG